jgi:hypothetical protein
MNIADARLIVHCPTCGARWELEYEPTRCVCDYADPEAVVTPWTVTVEAA